MCAYLRNDKRSPPRGEATHRRRCNWAHANCGAWRYYTGIFDEASTGLNKASWGAHNLPGLEIYTCWARKGYEDGVWHLVLGNILRVVELRVRPIVK